MKRAIQELKIARERNERRLVELERLWPEGTVEGQDVEGVMARNARQMIVEFRATIDSIDKALDVLERYDRGGIVDPVLDFQKRNPGAFAPSDRKTPKGQVGPPPASSYPGMLHGQPLDERADGNDE